MADVQRLRNDFFGYTGTRHKPSISILFKKKTLKWQNVSALTIGNPCHTQSHV